MKITRTSTISGKTHTMDISVTQKQLDDHKGGMLIQDAMPDISPEERDFIKLGITPTEWQKAFNVECE